MTQIEFKKIELLALYDTLIELTEKYNKNFTYAISLTKKSITMEVEALKEAMIPSDSYLEYEKERNAIIQKYAEKDADGEFIIKHGAIRLIKQYAEQCKAEIISIEDKYKETLIERDKDYESFDKILDEKILVNVEMINWEFVPENIEQSLMDALLPIITKG